MKILMSRENPNGYKLEELLEMISDDLKVKTALIQDSDDTCPAIPPIINNNRAIVKLLAQAKNLQIDSMRELDKVGEDKGPEQPRI